MVDAMTRLRGKITDPLLSHAIAVRDNAILAAGDWPEGSYGRAVCDLRVALDQIWYELALALHGGYKAG